MIRVKTLEQILEGWGNNIKDEFNLLEPEVKKLSEERLLLCNSCPLRRGNNCNRLKTGKAVKTFVYMKEMRTKGEEYRGCGCNISAKSKCLTCQCPLGKW